MKRITHYKFQTFLVIAAILFVTCTKEESDVRLDTKLSTSQYFNLASDSVTVVGYVIATGSDVSEKGICYNTAIDPTVANNKVLYTGASKKATYNVTLKNLNYATKYYARAYVIDETGTYYGEVIIFTTLPVAPTLLTTAITQITGNSASGGGAVTVNGGNSISARGICFGTNHNPTVSDSKTSNGTGMGAFTSALTNLKGFTTYYVRAYATNSAGTGYGPEVSFKTLVDLPAVTTTAVTDITKVSAKSGGEVTYDGGATVSERGLVWSLNENPTTADNVIAGGAGLGVFTSNLAGLTLYTKYYVRAYATNSAGTGYGSNLSFTTLANTRTWYIPGNYVAASYPGSTFADWSPDKSPQIKSTVTTPDNIEGYVYMAGASNNWKFATQPNWDGPNYTAGTPAGTLSESGPDISSPAGYYKLNVNASTDPMSYTAIATVWGVIGDATPGGWGAQTNMTYTPSTQQFSLAVHMTSGGAFKFRGTSDWSVNYGCTAADGKTLNPSGDNIAIAIEDDYAITLDLSHPNEYTYSANRWGIIGNATPGGWSTDTNLAWDGTNQVFKATLDLTAGSLKFRANDDWGINFGGTLNALTQDGADISIATGGNYTVTLNPWTKIATITQN